MTSLSRRATACSASLLVAAALSSPAAAQSTSDGQCADTARPLPPQRLLRRLSLDLRGHTPSPTEIAAQRQRDDVTESTIQGYLDSEAFVSVMRQHHEELLWPNIDQVELVPGTHELFPYPLAPGETVYLSAVRAAFVRAAGASNLFLPCRAEPAEFDADGRLILQPVTVGGEIVAYQEGYVEVAPYWAPDTTIKVCALDALDAEVGTVCPGPADRYPLAETICAQFDAYAAYVQAPFRDTETRCDGPLAILAPACGCGPHLRYCVTPETDRMIRASLLEQELRIVDRIIRADDGYEQILLTKSVEFNGPVVHYLEHMSGLSFDTFAGIDDSAPPPADLEYTDARWVPVTRTGRHAGVLTTPGYLLKFQTGRQRAHRFYNAFECSSFIPNGPLPSPFEPCSQQEDLTQRCGCDACHKTLEPMAAHWGRFAEYGFINLDEQAYPTIVDARCAPPISSVEQLFECFRLYELEPTEQEMPYRGYLNAYVFRTPADRISIAEGPTRLVQDSLASGRFDRCTVRRMWTHFMRREPNLEEDGTVIPELTAAYVASGRSLKTLVEAIVVEPAYGRQP